ncbi:unnamed protein product [Trichogramma brassicae]|uniref:Uncharacterized protein n=1 Tax=Trichogramma brassicae TaxID=86971 RepID=A0A6H5ILT6_9HYME|nr:unnamed protein product [Trichogramma brassicae]
MNFIEVTNNDYMAGCLCGSMEITQCIEYHWEKNVLDDFRYQDRKNAAILLAKRIIGFSIGDDYMLEVKNTRLKTAVNYFIEGDGFTVENYLNEFEQTDMKLTYENESGEIVSVLDKLTDKVKREAVEHYLLDNTFDEILSAIHDLFLEPLYDRGSASNQVGADYSLRNKFRIHLKQLYGAFKIFVEKFLDATNESLKADSGSATLPKLFCIGETDDGDEVLSVVEARIQNLNTMRCDRRPIVLPENKEAHLYIPLEFENLMVSFLDARDQFLSRNKVVVAPPEARSFHERDALQVAFTVSPLHEVPAPNIDDLRPGEAVDHRTPSKYEQLSIKDVAQSRYHPPPVSFKHKGLRGSASNSVASYSKPAATSVSSEYSTLDTKPKPAASVQSPYPIFTSSHYQPSASSMDYQTSMDNDKPPPSPSSSSSSSSSSLSFDINHPPKSIDFPDHYDRPFESVPSYAHDPYEVHHDEIIIDHPPYGDDDYYHHHHPHHDHDHDDYPHYYEHHHHPHYEKPMLAPPPQMTTEEPEIMDERVNKRPAYSYYYIGRKLWYVPLYFSIYFIIYIAALVLKSVARHKIQFPANLAAAAAADNARSTKVEGSDGPGWLDYVTLVLEGIEKFGEIAQASKTLKSVENEFEKRQTNHDNVHQDDGEAAVDNSKAVVSPRVVDHWNSYYDFLINEGSYKFWAIFQLATAALLIYSGFAALYYAKINPQFNEDTDEDLLFRKRRRRRSIGEKYRPSMDRPFFGLDPQVLQRIIDAVATEFH